MPRSFLITNKRYRGDLAPPSGPPPHQHPSAATNCLVPDAKTTDVCIGVEVAAESYNSKAEILDQTPPPPASSIENHHPLVTSPGKPNEETILKLYQDMRHGRLQLSLLPDLLLASPVSIDDDNASSVSPKSLYYGYETDLTKDQRTPDPLHTCPECGKGYSTTSNLARHRQTHRSADDKKARKCPHCDKLYVSSPAFSMHVRTHNQGCACPHCGKRFSRPWLLQGHIRTHTGEKPFECPKCGKTFADKSNLRAHIQTHSNEKPFACGRCGKGFALKSYLYKHEESSCMRSHRFYQQTSFHSHYHHHHNHPGAMTNAAAEVF